MMKYTKGDNMNFKLPTKTNKTMFGKLAKGKSSAEEIAKGLRDKIDRF